MLFSFLSAIVYSILLCLAEVWEYSATLIYTMLGVQLIFGLMTFLCLKYFNKLDDVELETNLMQYVEAVLDTRPSSVILTFIVFAVAIGTGFMWVAWGVITYQVILEYTLRKHVKVKFYEEVEKEEENKN